MKTLFPASEEGIAFSLFFRVLFRVAIPNLLAGRS
jgi:hypothetical protein